MLKLFLKLELYSKVKTKYSQEKEEIINCLIKWKSLWVVARPLLSFCSLILGSLFHCPAFQRPPPVWSAWPLTLNKASAKTYCHPSFPHNHIAMVTCGEANEAIPGLQTLSVYLMRPPLSLPVFKTETSSSISSGVGGESLWELAIIEVKASSRAVVQLHYMPHGQFIVLIFPFKEGL